MYGKIHERKLRQTDYILSCEEVRRQLDQYIDIENRRVNVDSAKKLAVIQHMDYEGFRQMVLGAHIFSTKSKELNNFSTGQDTSNLAQNKLFDEKKQEKVATNILAKVQGNSQNHCFSFRDFKKKFNKHYQKQLTQLKAEQCYTLIKEQDRNRLQKIFNLQCEADILLKIVQVFTFVLEFMKKEEKYEDIKIQCGFMIKYFQIILRIPTMQDISLNILTKKQRERIALFLENCKLILQEEAQIQTITGVIDLIKK